MKSYLKSIKGVMPDSGRKVDIAWQDRILIITGATGAGKTALLHFIYDRIETASSQKDLKSLPRLLATLENLREVEKYELAEGGLDKEWSSKLERVEAQLDDVTRELSLDLAKKATPISPVTGRFLRMFEANRATNILSANANDTLDIDKPQYGNPYDDHAKYLERCMLRRKLKQQSAEQSTGEPDFAAEKWFSDLERCLGLLLGDASTRVAFHPQRMQFSLSQKGRAEFSLQDLSKGQLAVISVWADLLVRLDTFDIAPSKFRGIVLIDELDAHLDINMQMQVLPFLIRQFSSLQFIVSTNSPLVIKSVQDALVYDVGRDHAHKKNYSDYSFEAIAQEVFQVNVAAAAG